MIEAHELTNRCSDTTAVHCLSFTIPPGTVTGFLGPNGVGKSTTMPMIMGLDRPTSGPASSALLTSGAVDDTGGHLSIRASLIVMPPTHSSP
ncbi:MAG: ATP-binding cassette domain-containing protein [Candidatus Nanopelagicales bacterium]